MGLFVSTVMTEPARKAKSLVKEFRAFCMERRKQMSYHDRKCAMRRRSTQTLSELQRERILIGWATASIRTNYTDYKGTLLENTE